MRGLKVIECRNSEISDLRFDQPPFLILFLQNLILVLILVSVFIFILQIEHDHMRKMAKIQCFARPSMMGDI